MSHPDPEVSSPPQPRQTVLHRVITMRIRSASGYLLVRSLLGLPIALAHLPGLISATEVLVRRIGRLVVTVEDIATQVAAVAAHAETVAQGADAVRSDAAGVAIEAGRLVEVLEAYTTRLVPLLDALADTDPELVRAAARVGNDLEPLLAAVADLDASIAADTQELLRDLPGLLRDVHQSVVPALDEMRNAVPDVRAMLPLVERLEPVLVDVETRIAGLPGARLLHRRGEREIEQTADDHSE